MKTVAIIPAYNEAARIVDAIRDAACFVDAVVVTDDCSQDATSTLAHEAGAYVLRHVMNRGQGAALQTATDFALDKLQAEIIVHFDADGQMMGEDIPLLIEPIKNGEADVVLGSRFLGKKANMPLSRLMTNRMALLFTLLVSGIRTTDTHNGFRALSREAAKKMRITLDRMAHASEILDLIQVQKLRYVERAVTIRYSEATLAKGQKFSGSFRIAKDFLKKQFLG